jgi:hypothetical protein
MAGIFEMLNSPVAQGLLAGGLGAMASRGSRMQALGRGGLLGMQVYGQAAGQQQNRLIEEAKKLQQQQALASLKPREGGGFTTDRMADLLQFMKPDEIQTALNLGRDKFKQMQEVTNADGSKSLYGVNEFGGINSTGLTNAPEIKTQDLGGAVVGVNPYTGQQAWDAQKTATIAELEAQRHNRASEGLTLRSQNLTDARAREKNQIDQGAVSKVEWKQGVNGEWIALPKEVSGDGPVTPIMTTVPGKRESQAAGSLGIIGEAEKLIDKATGSYLGAAVDTGARAFGLSPASAQAAAQLRALEGALMMAQPRMEGPQSDKDVALYKQMAGQIGDATVPAGQKKAALEVVKKLHQRYAGASTQQPQAPNERSVVRTGVFNGRKVVQYSDGSTAYAD